MFDILAKYLLEFKHLQLPKIGVFEVSAKEANADLASGTIAPPAWVVEFKTNRDEVGDNENELLYNWLATSQSISKEEAREAFKNFSADMEARLANEEKVEWPGLGVLEQMDDQNIFVPTTDNLSPFTNVSAKKIIRENSSHATIVGDKETTTSHMREQLLLPDEPRRTGNTVMWVLLVVSAVVAIVYFSQNGCNKAATGNHQKAEAAKSSETYKLQ